MSRFREGSRCPSSPFSCSRARSPGASRTRSCSPWSRFAADRALPVGPNVPIVWETGADPAGRAAGERPPNIVIILADDLGWNDLTFGGGGVAGGRAPTPHIDSIARDGVRFLAGYSANGTCAPSRASVMSGRYATRFGFEFTPTPASMTTIAAVHRARHARPDRASRSGSTAAARCRSSEMGMPASEITIAELVKPAGYHTVHIGKWHLGGVNGMSAHEQGFDESLLDGERALPAGGRPERRELAPGLRPDRPLPVGRDQVRRVVQRRPRVRAARLPHRLLHRRGGEGDRGQQGPPVPALPGVLGAAHPAAGDEGRLRRAVADRGSAPARLRGDDPRARPRRGARARRPARERPRRQHARLLHLRQRRAQLHRPAGGEQAVPRLEDHLLRGRHSRAVLPALAEAGRGRPGLHRAGARLRHLRDRRRGGRRAAARGSPDRRRGSRCPTCAASARARRIASSSGARATTGWCWPTAGSCR